MARATWRCCSYRLNFQKVRNSVVESKKNIEHIFKTDWSNAKNPQSWLLTVPIRPEQSSDATSPPWGLDHQQTGRISDMWLFELVVPCCPEEWSRLSFGGKLWAGKWCPRQMKNIGFEFLCLSNLCNISSGKWKLSEERLPQPTAWDWDHVLIPLGPYTLDDPWYKRHNTRE